MVRLLVLIMPISEAEELFTVTFKVVQESTRAGTIGRFFTKSQTTCIWCRSPLKGGGSPRVCNDCKATSETVVMAAYQARRWAEEDYQRLWSKCGTCQQGSHLWDVMCRNESCPVLYRRIKAQRQLEEAGNKVEEVAEALNAMLVSH